MMLIEFEGHDHGELGNLHFKLLSVYDSFHVIAAEHLADAGLEVAARDILVGIARLKDGLLTDYTFPFYLSDHIAGIMDEPVSAAQLYGVLAVILDGNTIGKDIVELAGIGVFG